ncbi:hypothetical protein SAMN04487916_107208 [Arthrobacter sp. ov407]|nr:hypothetical protein SAMN04487916_107208 [Arthrobacter sp. ov407]
MACELFDPAWFRSMNAEGVSAAALREQKLPVAYDLVLMSGNVAAFLTPESLVQTFKHVASLLNPGGFLIVGTSTHSRGGPAAQELAATGSGLTLTHRYSDWHLGLFSEESPWSVSVYSNDGSRRAAGGPDGIFVLGS